MRDQFIELSFTLADSLEAMWDEQKYWAHSYTRAPFRGCCLREAPVLDTPCGSAQALVFDVDGTLYPAQGGARSQR